MLRSMIDCIRMRVLAFDVYGTPSMFRVCMRLPSRFLVRWPLHSSFAGLSYSPGWRGGTQYLADFQQRVGCHRRKVRRSSHGLGSPQSGSNIWSMCLWAWRYRKGSDRVRVFFRGLRQP